MLVTRWNFDIENAEEFVNKNIDKVVEGAKFWFMGQNVVMKFGEYKDRVARIEEIIWSGGRLHFQCRVYRLVPPFGEFIEDHDTYAYFPRDYFEFTDQAAPGTGGKHVD